MAGTSAEIQNKRPGRGASVLDIYENFTAIDIETTGLDPEYCDIIEVAAIRYRAGMKVARFTSFVSIDYEIPAFIQSLTGITDAMLEGAPDASVILPKFCEFLGDDVLIGNNTFFDVNFIYDECLERDLPPIKNNFLNIGRIARRLRPDLENYRLHTILDAFGIVNHAPHRAEGDATATGDCYIAMVQKIQTDGIDVNSLFADKHKHGHGVKAASIVATSNDFDESSPIYQKTFVFTGALDRMVRRDAMQLVVNHGGKVADGVNKATNYLVLGNNAYCTTIKDGKSSKQKKAEAYKLAGLDIDIISENVFFDMLQE